MQCVYLAEEFHLSVLGVRRPYDRPQSLHSLLLDNTGTVAERAALGSSCLFDPLDQSVLVEGHGLGTLVQVVLVAGAELQDLGGVQPLQTHAAGGRLAAQHSCTHTGPSQSHSAR